MAFGLLDSPDHRKSSGDLWWKRRQGVWRFAIFLVIAAMLLVPSTLAHGQIRSMAAVGQSDPLNVPSQHMVFRDDELMPWVPSSLASLDVRRERATTDLSSLADSGLGTTIGMNGRLAAQHPLAKSGRIVDPGSDQVVWAATQAGVSLPLAALQVGLAGVPGSTLVLQNYTGFGNDALAVGDLDNVGDAAGNYHDEVAVALNEKTDPRKLDLAVLNYSGASAAHPQPSAITRQTAAAPLVSDADPAVWYAGARKVDVAIGNFLGDGKNEIALVYLTDSTHLEISVWRYTTDTRGTHALVRVDDNAFPIDSASGYSPNGFIGALSVASGDFTGDGRDQLAVTTAFHGTVSQGLSVFSNAPAISTRIYESDTNSLHMRAATDPYIFPDLGFQANGGASIAEPRPQLVAGLFKYDPANGFGLDRRELALLVNRSDGTAFVKTFYVPHKSPAITDLTNQLDVPRLSWLNRADERLSLAAGNFVGVRDPNQPTWEIAYGAWTKDFFGSHLLTGLLKVGGAQLEYGAQHAYPAATPPLASSYSPPLIPYDALGNALELGAPVHLVVSDVKSTDSIIEEPPQQLDCFGTTANDFNPSDQTQNVSRNPDFYVALNDSHQTMFSSSYTQTIGTSYGISNAVNAKASVSYPADLDEAPTGAEVFGEFKYAWSNETNTTQKQYTHLQTEQHVQFEAKTSSDDYLETSLRTYDIWRYRIYGMSERVGGQTRNGFFEIVIPGTPVKAGMPTRDVDQYQPIHENGNVLSYPSVPGNSATNYTPPDLGTWQQKIDEAHIQVHRTPLFSADQAGRAFTWGGNEYTYNLDWTQETGNGGTFSWEQKNATNMDITAGAKFKTALGPVGVNVEGSYNRSVNGSTTNADETIAEAQDNKTQGLEIHQPAGGFTGSYTYFPVIYISNDGAFKVAQAVQPPSGSYWAQFYGRKPDPGLNLPRRIELNTSGQGFNGAYTFSVNALSDRKKMRGFFVTSPNRNPATHNYDDLTFTPVAAGQTVRLVARVYNFSTNQPVYNVRVRFQAVKYDSGTDLESGPRITIGDAIIPSLGAPDMKEASVIWNTAGFGPGFNPSQQYKIYVVVDPNHQINSIHQPEPAGTVDPCQNKEGYGVVTVANPGQAGIAGSQPVNAHLGSPTMQPISSHFALQRDAILSGGSSLKSAVKVVPLGQTVRLGFKVFASRPAQRDSDLLVFDGDPRAGHGIADAQVFADQRGNTAWVDWTASTPGLHRITAVLPDDVAHPNRTVSMYLLVVAPPSTQHAGRPQVSARPQ